jgi:hypothetical protein
MYFHACPHLQRYYFLLQKTNADAATDINDQMKALMEDSIGGGDVGGVAGEGGFLVICHSKLHLEMLHLEILDPHYFGSL